MIDLVTQLVVNVAFGSALLVQDQIVYVADTYEVPPAEVLDASVAISTYTNWWTNGGCYYRGRMIPFARTWKEVILDNEGNVFREIEGDPTRRAGFAILFTEKECDGKVEPILRWTEVLNALTIGQFKLHRSRTLKAKDLLGLRPDDRPKWLDQVMTRIIKLAGQDAELQKFRDAIANYVQANASADQLAAATKPDNMSDESTLVTVVEPTSTAASAKQ